MKYIFVVNLVGDINVNIFHYKLVQIQSCANLNCTSYMFCG